MFALLPSLTAIVISLVSGRRPSDMIRQYWMLPLYMIAGSSLGARLLIVADPAPFLVVLALLIVAHLNVQR
ncbi:MAG: hypothetical protein ABIS68_06645 [Casimicrobiaceae bacterium]